MNIKEIRTQVELDIEDDTGTNATFITAGFGEENIKSLVAEYAANNREVKLINLHEHLLSRRRSNQQTVSIIFKNT